MSPTQRTTAGGMGGNPAADTGTTVTLTGATMQTATDTGQTTGTK